MGLNDWRKLVLELNPSWRNKVKPSSLVAKFADYYVDWGGGHMLPSQTQFLNRAYSKRRNGDWVYKTIADNEPRQNGKSKKLEAPILTKLYAYNEDIFYTAHELDMVQNMFQIIWNDIQRNPTLASRVKNHSGTSGKEFITLTTGGTIRFRCRKNGLSGMGGTKDTVIFDEAQELTAEYESMVNKVLRTKPNAQIIYCGTPFLPASGGDTFNLLLERAKEDDTVFAVRYGVDDENCDVEDKALWKLTNPLYPDVINDSSFTDDLALARQSGEEGLRDFRIQDLGLWWKDKIPPAIPVALWESSTIPDMPTDSHTNVVAIVNDPTTSTIGMSIAAYNAKVEDGKNEVEAHQYVIGDIKAERSGMDNWSWIAEAIDNLSRDTIVLTDLGGLDKPITDMLNDSLSQRPSIVKFNGPEFLASQQGFLDLLQSGKFKNLGNPSLNDEVHNAQKSQSGNGWKFTPIRPEHTLVGLKALTMATWYRSVTQVKERVPVVVYS